MGQPFTSDLHYQKWGTHLHRIYALSSLPVFDSSTGSGAAFISTLCVHIPLFSQLGLMAYLFQFFFLFQSRLLIYYSPCVGYRVHTDFHLFPEVGHSPLWSMNLTSLLGHIVISISISIYNYSLPAFNCMCQ